MIEVVGNYIICKVQICKPSEEETAEDLGVEVDYTLADAIVCLEDIHHCFKFENDFIKVVYKSGDSLLVESTFKNFIQIYRKYLFEKNFLIKNN